MSIFHQNTRQLLDKLFDDGFLLDTAMTADGGLDLLGREPLYLETHLFSGQLTDTGDRGGREAAGDVLIVKHPLDSNTFRGVNLIEFGDLRVDVQQSRRFVT